ncbi:MAG: hypothetical protein COA43_09220 [Robiginitomaculum sp.]|nr:MAG: hypothetical protein COA43_09220 [Robiginitomaculum sp.]
MFNPRRSMLFLVGATIFTFSNMSSIALAQVESQPAVSAVQHSAMFTQAQELISKEEFKSAIKMLVVTQSNGEDTLEISQLLSEAYAGRIEQVGMLKKLKLAKKIKKSMEHSLKLSPGNLDAMSGLVQFHLQAPSVAGGDKDVARQLITEITKQDLLQGHQLLGNLESAEDNYAAALQSFEACLVLEPVDKNCLYQVGRISQVGNIQLEKGKAAFVKFLETYPDDKMYTPHAHFRLGNLYKQLDDMTAAKTQYELAIKMSGHEGAKKALAKR